MNEVIYTGLIPQCPHCKKPTKRTSHGSSSTLMYYMPVYDENGVNTNPDRNTITTAYECLECNKTYVVSGNNVDGYNYKK